MPRHAGRPCLATNKTNKDKNPGPVEFRLCSPIAKLPLLLDSIFFLEGSNRFEERIGLKIRRATSGAAGSGLGATMKYLRRTTSAATNNGMSTTITPPRGAASFEVNSEPHTGARPSVRLCEGPELARCVHYGD